MVPTSGEINVIEANAKVKAELYTRGIWSGKIVESDEKKSMMTYLLSLGTEFVLTNHDDDMFVAMIIALSILELEFGQANDWKSDPKSLPVIRDFFGGLPEKEVTRFYAKRISCGCLDSLYKNVKKQPSVGYCYNCRELKERRTLLICQGCNGIQYCSKECQQMNWSQHRRVCANMARQST